MEATAVVNWIAELRARLAGQIKMRIVLTGIICVALCACAEQRPSSLIRSSATDTAHVRSSLTEYQFRDGAIRFRAPSHWHVLKTPAPDDDEAIFHVRHAAVDSGSERTNVMVWVLQGPAAMPFRVATDGVLTGAVSGVVLGDTILGRPRNPADPERRFVFWRGQEGEKVYAVYEDFGRRDTLMVHVRVAVPITAMTSAAWADSLEVGTRQLLESVTVGGVALFPGWAGHPNLSTWGARSP